jgi:hypothetical protein
MTAPLHGSGRPPPENEAARQSGSADAKPKTSISGNASEIVAPIGRRKRGDIGRGVSRRAPPGEAIRTAMRFLAPWGSR